MQKIYHRLRNPDVNNCANVVAAVEYEENKANYTKKVSELARRSLEENCGSTK